MPVPNPAWSGDVPDPGTSRCEHKIDNIGNHQPVELLYFIEVLEALPGAKRPKRTCCRSKSGDVPATYADVDDLVRDVGFQPATPIEEGIARFVTWYREYYRVE